MPTKQLVECVNTLSNKAECLIRHLYYLDAVTVASEALQLDACHERSLFRRAKANDLHHKAQNQDPLYFLSSLEDLERIISFNGDGAPKAEELRDEINSIMRRSFPSLSYRGDGF